MGQFLFFYYNFFCRWHRAENVFFKRVSLKTKLAAVDLHRLISDVRRTIYSVLPRVRCFWAIDSCVPQHASSPSDENNIIRKLIVVDPIHIRLDLNEDRAILPKPRNIFELKRGNQKSFELEKHL
jgi:hypothetical protein